MVFLFIVVVVGLTRVELGLFSTENLVDKAMANNTIRMLYKPSVNTVPYIVFL